MKTDKIYFISSKILMLLTKIELYLSFTFLILIFIIVSCEVVGRYFFNSPIFWSNEACILLHTYVICFGYAVIYINKKDIYLLVVYNVIPKGKQWLLDLFAEAIILLFTIMLVYLSVKYFSEHGNYIAGGLGIPQGFFSFPIIITSLSLLLVTLSDLYKMAINRYKTDGEKEAHIIV
jgi:TRAP-type C4-dicarboxylate transport system permease small subunit